MATASSRRSAKLTAAVARHERSAGQACFALASLLSSAPSDWPRRAHGAHLAGERFRALDKSNGTTPSATAQSPESAPEFRLFGREQQSGAGAETARSRSRRHSSSGLAEACTWRVRLVRVALGRGAGTERN